MCTDIYHPPTSWLAWCFSHLYEVPSRHAVDWWDVTLEDQSPMPVWVLFTDTRMRNTNKQSKHAFRYLNLPFKLVYQILHSTTARPVTRLGLDTWLQMMPFHPSVPPSRTDRAFCEQARFNLTYQLRAREEVASCLQQQSHWPRLHQAWPIAIWWSEPITNCKYVSVYSKARYNSHSAAI